MKTRSYRELFQLMIDNHELFNTGLCTLIGRMWENDIIIYDELVKLIKYIKSHRPKKGKHYDPFMKDSIWFWKRNEWPPRLAWLLDQIKKYS